MFEFTCACIFLALTLFHRSYRNKKISKAKARSFIKPGVRLKEKTV